MRRRIAFRPSLPAGTLRKSRGRSSRYGGCCLAGSSTAAQPTKSRAAIRREADERHTVPDHWTEEVRAASGAETGLAQGPGAWRAELPAAEAAHAGAAPPH